MFKVGDRVKVYTGATGTVIDINHPQGKVVAEMDDPNKGVRTTFYENKSILWLDEKDFSLLIPRNKIVITTDGTETLARLYEGEKVKKSTKATCSPDDTFDFMTGAKIAFERLIAEDKPQPANPEPTLLYCVKSYEPGEWVTKDKIYTLDSEGRITFDDGYSLILSKMSKPCFQTKWLFPLVKRPAKVGEWVYITKSAESRAVNGNIYHVVENASEDTLFVKHPDGKRFSDHAANIYPSEYLVLDGYHPEPELFNGKVVCVEKKLSDTTLGKKYVFKDGFSKYDDGRRMPCMGAGVKSLEELNARSGSQFALLIEADE